MARIQWTHCRRDREGAVLDRGGRGNEKARRREPTVNSGRVTTVRPIGVACRTRVRSIGDYACSTEEGRLRTLEERAVFDEITAGNAGGGAPRMPRLSMAFNKVRLSNDDRESNQGKSAS
jgi:hypothetical protein